jgi:hypothetical protein
MASITIAIPINISGAFTTSARPSQNARIGDVIGSRCS